MKNTSWGSVAKKYQAHLQKEDSYHAKVVLPNVLRVVNPSKDINILDIGCGEGYFSRQFAQLGATVCASDISPELIALAKKESARVTYFVANSEHLSFAQDGQFDVITAILTIQNCENIRTIFYECARVLKKNGRFVLVLNHPAFRVPGNSSWGNNGGQYRRVDKYMSSFTSEILMNPGNYYNGVSPKKTTVSFHRPLQEYVKALKAAGLVIVGLEEWISHRKSEAGPKKTAEDMARKEIPLFMCLECKKI